MLDASLALGLKTQTVSCSREKDSPVFTKQGAGVPDAARALFSSNAFRRRDARKQSRSFARLNQETQPQLQQVCLSPNDQTLRHF